MQIAPFNGWLMRTLAYVIVIELWIQIPYPLDKINPINKKKFLVKPTGNT